MTSKIRLVETIDETGKVKVAITMEMLSLLKLSHAGSSKDRGVIERVPHSLYLLGEDGHG